MEKYLIAVDIDGTLLWDLYSLSDFSVKVFNKLRELGHKIIITTGRPKRSSYFIYKKFNLDTPMINYNGGLIQNPSDPSFQNINAYIPREAIIDIYLTLKDKYQLFFSEYNDHIISNKDDQEFYLLMHHNTESTLEIGDIDKLLKTGVHGTLMLAKKNEGINIKKYVENKYENIGVRIWKWFQYDEIIELYLKDISKATAIDYISKYLGFDKDHIIACGDSQNDIEMFSEAGITVSLNNASQEIKEMSTYVYDVSCNDDGIAKFMNEYFKLGVNNDK